LLNVVIDNRNGTLWDISQIVSSVTWKMSRIGKPSSIDLTFIKGGIYQDTSFAMNTGDVIRIRSVEPNADLFYGYVFEIADGQDEDVTIKAYDQIRYLLANDTYVFKNITASEVIKRIADDFSLKTGVIEDTGYKIPKMLEDNKKLLDIIWKGLTMTLINSGRNFSFFDDFGALSLQNIENRVVDFFIGDASLMIGYDSFRSIEDSYNRVKLVQDNKNTKKRDVYIIQDSANIDKWGKLQLFHKVDEDLNAAQINEMLQRLIETKNREQRKFRIEAIGDVRIRAGSYVRIIIDKLGINQLFLVDECTHKFDEGDHTMSMEMRLI